MLRVHPREHLQASPKLPGWSHPLEPFLPKAASAEHQLRAGKGVLLHQLPPRTTSCLCIHHQGWAWPRTGHPSVSNESLWLFDLFIMLSGKSTNPTQMSLPSRFSAAMSYSSPVGCSYTVSHIRHLYKAAALREITCHYLRYESVLLIKPLKPAKRGRRLGGRRVSAGVEAGSAHHTMAVPPRFSAWVRPCLVQVGCSDAIASCLLSSVAVAGQSSTCPSPAASAVAPRSDLNAVTLQEVDKILYKNKNPPKNPSPRDCSSRCPLFEALLALICRSCWAQPGSACMEWGRKDHLPVPHISPLPPAFDGIFLSASKGLSSDLTAGPERVPMVYVAMPPVATGSSAPSKSWSSFMMRSLHTLLPSSASFNPQTSQQVKGTWQIWGQGARRVRKTSLSGPHIFVPLALLLYLPLPHPQSSLIPIIWFV